MKIDKRKKYFLVLDVEGAGELDCAFVYDVGGAVVDKRCNIYDSFSFAVSDIFENEPFGILETAYYADKLPLYDVKIESEIMARCFRQHKKMNRYPSRWCWRIPQGKAV